METFQIPRQNLDKTIKHLEKLNRIAAKLGQEPIQFSTGKTEMREITLPVSPSDQVHPHERSRKIWVEYIDFSVDGKAPKLNGWRFVAVLQHEENGNIVRTVPGETLPTKYRTVEPQCDYCRTNRRRKDTYIVANDQNEFKQVGSGCIKDFLGHKSPEAVVGHAVALMLFSETLEMWEEDLYFSASWQAFIPTHTYMSWVVKVVEMSNGIWKSRKNSDFDNPSTADIALSLMYDTKTKAPTAEHRDLAKTILDEVLVDLNKKDTARMGDYEWNLYTAVGREFMKDRDAGLVSSAYIYWKRLKEKEAEELARAAAGCSLHVGEVGERLQFDYLEVEHTRSWESLYGETYLYDFRDADGNKITWFASRNQQLEPGDVVCGKATVKEHGQFNGENQTIITRAKIKEFENA